MPNSMSDRGKIEAEEDPLIELARIVSEDGGFSAPKHEKPKMTRNEPTPRSGYAEGLEAELLQELETSLTTRDPKPAAPAAVSPRTSPRPAPVASQARPAPAPRAGVEERDPDDLLRSIEEQLGQFERRQAERHASARPAPDPDEDPSPAVEPEPQFAATIPMAEAPAVPNSRDTWDSPVSRLRPLDDDDLEDAPSTDDWSQEPVPVARSDYRFRGPANAEWDRAAPEPEPQVTPVSKAETRSRRVEELPGFGDEPTDVDLFAGKRARARDLFGEDEDSAVAETTEALFSSEGTRRRRIVDAFPEFGDEPVAPAPTDERAALNARLAEALESDYSDADHAPARKTPPSPEAHDDEPKIAAVVAAGASRRAAAARAQAAQRSKGARTVLVTALGVMVVVLLGGAAALYLRSTESAPGAPPVIAADEGPVKVDAPEEQAAAEGETVGEAVYNRVAGNAPSADEQVVDSAEEPREVARIVLPQTQTGSSDTVVRPIGEAATAEASAEPEASGLGPRRVPTYTVRPDGTIVANSAAEPAAAASPEPQAPPSTAEAEELPSADEALGAAPQEPMTPRPAIDEPQVAVAEPQPAAPPPAAPAPQQEAPVNLLTGSNAPAAPAPAPTASDGYLVQISSQRSMDAAQSSYADIQQRYPSVLGNLDPVIQEADLGTKGIYFRVRVGPWASRDEAIQVCESLKAAGGSCFVTQ